MHFCANFEQTSFAMDVSKEDTKGYMKKSRSNIDVRKQLQMLKLCSFSRATKADLGVKTFSFPKKTDLFFENLVSILQGL